MPEPDVVFELALGAAPCPEDSQRELLQGLIENAVPLGESMRARNICSNRQAFNGNVLSVGLWADDKGDSDEQLDAALMAAGPLVPGNEVGLFFAVKGIQYLAAASWAKMPKKIDASVGFVRFGNDIGVVINGNDIVTNITGQWKIRWAPNISFSLTAQERLALNIPGSTPALTSSSSRNISTKGVKLLQAFASVLFALISPMLGALAFWAVGREVDSESSTAAANASGAGSSLATQWPSIVLTPVSPPYLLGKLVFLWTGPGEVVDKKGVRTLGAVFPESRSPKVVISGPTMLSAKLPSNSASPTYTITTQDLRGKLKIQWSIDGNPAGHASTQQVEIGLGGLDPGTVSRRVRVEVSDEDDLTATRELTVTLKVTVPAGKEPF